ncbi:MAG: group II intron maturase-specific domain-containing protein [Thiolinea sp.]
MFNPILRGWWQYYGRFYPSKTAWTGMPHQWISGSLVAEKIQATYRP